MGVPNQPEQPEPLTGVSAAERTRPVRTTAGEEAFASDVLAAAQKLRPVKDAKVEFVVMGWDSYYVFDCGGYHYTLPRVTIALAQAAVCWKGNAMRFYVRLSKENPNYKWILTGYLYLIEQKKLGTKDFINEELSEQIETQAYPRFEKEFVKGGWR